MGLEARDQKESIDHLLRFERTYREKKDKELMEPSIHSKLRLHQLSEELSLVKKRH